MKDTIPIALFAYARPEHLLQTLEGLKRNKVPLIYAFCDGPRDNTIADQVRHVRRILKNIDWARIIITEREINLGLGKSIRSGVTEVLTNHEKVIVIEDDIVLRPGAYKYACDALNFFDNNKEIMSVSMWNHPVFVPKSKKTGFFSKRFMCWGWGTYSWAWKLYKGSPKEIYNECINQGINALEWGKDIKWQVDMSEKRNLWYVGFALTHMLYNKLTYYPYEKLTLNFGKDSSGVNDGEHLYYKENYKLVNTPVTPFKKDGLEKFIISKKLPARTRKYFDRTKKTLGFKMKNRLKKLWKLFQNKTFGIIKKLPLNLQI